jgi:hypothetical protein
MRRVKSREEKNSEERKRIFLCMLPRGGKEKAAKIFLQFSSNRARLTFEEVVVVNRKTFFMYHIQLSQRKARKKSDLEEKEKNI